MVSVTLGTALPSWSRWDPAGNLSIAAFASPTLSAWQPQASEICLSPLRVPAWLMGAGGSGGGLEAGQPAGDRSWERPGEGLLFPAAPLELSCCVVSCPWCFPRKEIECSTVGL